MTCNWAGTCRRLSCRPEADTAVCDTGHCIVVVVVAGDGDIGLDSYWTQETVVGDCKCLH